MYKVIVITMYEGDITSPDKVTSAVFSIPKSKATLGTVQHCINKLRDCGHVSEDSDIMFIQTLFADEGDEVMFGDPIPTQDSTVTVFPVNNDGDLLLVNKLLQFQRIV